MSNQKQTVVFDFDGVIHSYTSGWKGIELIPDPPVRGIGRAISLIRDHYKVVVVSTRCAEERGKKAIEAYLKTHGIEVDGIEAEKPPAVVYVDDRAICFDGHADTLLRKVLTFKPWTDRSNEESQISKLCSEVRESVSFFRMHHGEMPNVLYVSNDLYAVIKASCRDITEPDYNLIEIRNFMGLDVKITSESGMRWAVAREHIIGGIS